jgi:hypothetical protein
LHGTPEAGFSRFFRARGPRFCVGPWEFSPVGQFPQPSLTAC